MNKFILLFLPIFTAGLAARPQTSYVPEMVFGHRSMAYQHNISHCFSKGKTQLTNVVLYDVEYRNNKNSIYFIRNTINYYFKKGISIVAGIGLKNPGPFSMLAMQYQYKEKNFSFSYSIGPTYRQGFTLEQSISGAYTKDINTTFQGILKAQVVANLNSDYDRGFQQIRAGLKTQNFQFGLAANFDQFQNASKTLENYGLFIKTTL